MNPGDVPRRFYPGIEILRGFAALMVLVYHVIAHGQWAAFPEQGPLLLFRMGWLGVDLFLVISGFVITLAVIGGVARSGDLAGFRRDFAARRWRRIAPLYFLTMLAFLFMVEPGLLLQGWQTLAWHLGTHALFVHNMTVATHGAFKKAIASMPEGERPEFAPVPNLVEAIRMIKQGAVKLNGETKIEDSKLEVAKGSTQIYQVGKRKFAKITLL